MRMGRDDSVDVLGINSRGSQALQKFASRWTEHG